MSPPNPCNCTYVPSGQILTCFGYPCDDAKSRGLAGTMLEGGGAGNGESETVRFATGLSEVQRNEVTDDGEL
jgi:hypothetical protein